MTDDRAAEGGVRCWWCGIEPHDVQTFAAFGGPVGIIPTCGRRLPDRLASRNLIHVITKGGPMEATTRRTTWRDISGYVDFDDRVLDSAGRVWRRRARNDEGRVLLVLEGNFTAGWVPRDDDVAMLPAPPIPEPPDGTRIEFEHNTDVYAAWRDDAGSAAAGWTAGDGGDTWVLYGETVPMPWAAMYAMFGESLALAVRLVPHPDDLAKRDQWPTVVRERETAVGGEPHGQE